MKQSKQSGKETINTAARYAGRTYIKNRLIIASCYGPVVGCAMKLSSK